MTSLIAGALGTPVPWDVALAALGGATVVPALLQAWIRRERRGANVDREVRVADAAVGLMDQQASALETAWRRLAELEEDNARLRDTARKVEDELQRTIGEYRQQIRALQIVMDEMSKEAD